MHSTSVYPNYFNQGLGIRDFLFRGNVRAEKDTLLRKTEDDVLYLRKYLEERLQGFEKKHFNRSLRVFTPETQPFTQRVFSWIRGDDRILQLRHKEAFARSLTNEAISMKYDMARIEKLHKDYLKATNEMLEAAKDAVDYELVTKCGWTWWR